VRQRTSGKSRASYSKLRKLELVMTTFRPLIITFAVWFAALFVSYILHRLLEIVGA
jgi:hypothetical protein